MASVKQPGLGAISLFHIVVIAVLVSQACLLLQPAWARALDMDRRLLAASDKVTGPVANKDTEIVAKEANRDTRIIAKEDAPVGDTYWGGGGWGNGGGYGNGWNHGGGGYGHGGGWGHGGGGYGHGGGGYGHGGGGCCDDDDNKRP